MPSAAGGRTGAAFEPRPAALVLEAGRRYALTVVNVGLACCAVEAMVASLGSQAVPGAVPRAGAGQRVDVLVVSGTVTDKLARLVRGLYDALPGPVRVVSFGACANSGGPYWDSYCVTRGVDLVVPVDVYVPGCPPRPQALLDALAALDTPAGTAGRREAADLLAPLVPAPPTAPAPTAPAPTAAPEGGSLS